jgi:hypothetical protein
MRFALLLLFPVALVTSAVGDEPFCIGGDEMDPEKSADIYPYPLEDGKLRAKFIFVGFPGEDIDHTLTHEDHGVFIDYMRDYLALQTYGKLTLHEDSSVLLPPGEVLDELNDSVAWIADLEALNYQELEPSPWPYLSENPELSNWFNTADGSRIYAEILHRIWKAYEGHDNPFPAPDDGEPGWELIISFLVTPGGDSPMEYWRPWISVNTHVIQLATDGFFDNVRRRSSLENASFAGSGQIALGRYVTHGQSERMAVFFYVLHEWAHTLYISDGPPNLGEHDDVPHLARYHYGNLNLMTQSFGPVNKNDANEYATFYGFPPIGDHWLQFLPWNAPPGETSSVVDLTGRCVFRAKIYDVTTGGQLYKLNVGAYEGAKQEYFLLGYHGGNGIDGYIHDPSDPDARPTVSSQGLAIWHCIGHLVGRSVSYVDLEVATGLHRYDAVDMNPLEEWSEPWEVESLEEDPESGYDGYDYWIGRNRGEWRHFSGSPGDFFRIDYDDQSPYYNDTFSFNTNPNCFGYERGHSTYDIRRAPQDVPNSLIVRILEMGVEEVPDERQYLVVDILFAPAARLTPGSEILLATEVEIGAQIPLEFEQDYLDSIESFNVFYSATGGASWFWTVAEDVALDHSNPVFVWEPTEELWSQQGKLRFEFVNTFTEEINESGRYQSLGISNAVGYYETEVFSFLDEGVVTVLEEIVTPNGGEVLYEGMECEIRWTKYFDDEPSSVAVHYDLNETGNWQEWAVYYQGGQPGWVVDPEANEYVALATPTAEMCASNVRIKLIFYSGDREASTVSAATFEVYPTPIMFVEEDAEDHGVNYDGRPYGTAAFHDDGNQYVLVTIEQGLPDGPGFALYENVRGQFEINLRFEDVATDEFYGTLPTPGFRGLAVAAHDSPSNIKIFMAHETDPALYVKQSDNKWHNVIDDPQYFDPEEKHLAGYSYCASWVDINRDGHLDLYIGRGMNSDVLFDVVFLRGDATSEPRFSVDDDIFGSAVDNSVSTRAIAWTDYDSNGLWNLVVSGVVGRDHGGAPAVYWKQRQDGSFGRESIPGLQSTYYSRGHGVRFVDWVDHNQDNSLELILVNPVTNDKSEILVFENPREVPLSSEIPVVVGGGSTGDLDLDGRPELILIGGPHEKPTTAALNVSADPNFTREYAATSTAVGLDDTHFAWTIALADFGGDGDLDLVLGISDLEGDKSGRVKRAKLPFGDEESPQNNWLGVRLDGQAEDNPWGIGATIRLSDFSGLPLGSQIVHGGGGRGGQPSPTRIFGLGSYDNNVLIEVRWPLGFVQEFSISAINLNSVVTATQSIGCELDEDSVDLEIVFNPGDSTIDWVFTWTTDRWTKTEEDQVTITRELGSDCGFEEVVLQAGVGQDIEVLPVQYVTAGEFRHEVRWLSQPCHPGCTYSYTVRSWDGRSGSPGSEVISNPRQIRFRICPSSQ